MMNANEVGKDKQAPSEDLATGIPFDVLKGFCDRKTTGLLQLFGNQVIWIVRIEGGKITFATNSIEKFDRLICHMRMMSHQIPRLTKEFRAQVCMKFEDTTESISEDMTGYGNIDPSLRTNDYTAICWLVKQQYLTYVQGALLLESISKEAIEPLFWLDNITYRFHPGLGNEPTIYATELMPLAMFCQQRLRLWQLLAPQIWSPYQRPYFFGQTEKQKQILPELQLHQRFRTILKGFSFRHLAILLNRDELKIAGSLMPYICEEVVILRDPQPPFDVLPKVPEALPTSFARLTNQVISQQVDMMAQGEDPTLLQTEIPAQTKNYTIACVDDSPTVLNEISRFLSEDSFKIVAIRDPLKALLQILKAKPDLILMDVTMPKINGYELCRLIRKNPKFKSTPIIMVTGNTGIIDRAKAKLSGSTDYMTKPFTQEGLLKMVFRHLD
ncbi:response regulator receiver protein [Thalassoporum mexicanum PCC 7367]|uniref:response regulator n=1 Tax=Thalassoporum mexicanum TaxID=3457544 RepID=UPI00029F9E0D|nr:response regulator [Pseudanabaena sp. PCC 7367]AFY70677.1 response regulator receiver protein [Pseudanabaena sp. PCC 7367]